MSSPQLAAARALWRGRRKRSRAERAIAVYASFLVAVVVFVPLVRAAWVALASPGGVAMLTAAGAPAVTSFVIAALWAAALLAGRSCGPALMAPFPLHALANSGIRRSLALRRPVIRAGATITTTLACAAALLAAVLIGADEARMPNVMAFVCVVIAVGAITTSVWLVGQVFPRAAIPLASAVMGLAALSLFLPDLLAFVPWGWVGATYPLGEPGEVPLIGVAAFAALLAAATPPLLNLLTGTQLHVQAHNFERALAFSVAFEFGAAAALYRNGPQFGRHLRAVHARMPRVLTFLIRDAIGQLRTPGRFLAAVGVTASAGALVSLSLSPGTPTVSAAFAGILTHLASASLARSLQHAAHAVSDYPLYGVNDRAMVLLHALFPLVVTTGALSAGATITALTIGVPLGITLATAIALAVIALACRLSGELKGPLPPILLTPIETPVGDASVLVRVVWALGDVALVIMGGLALALLPQTPIPLLLLATWVGLLIGIRWSKRR